MNIRKRPRSSISVDNVTLKTIPNPIPENEFVSQKRGFEQNPRECFEQNPRESGNPNLNYGESNYGGGGPSHLNRFSTHPASSHPAANLNLVPLVTHENLVLSNEMTGEDLKEIHLIQGLILRTGYLLILAPD